MAFVYLMASGRNIIKVGLAKDVGRRRRALQTAVPFDLKVLHRIEVVDSSALELQQRIHKRLKRYRIRGEWFRVEPDVAISISERAASQFAKDRTIAKPDDDDRALARLRCRTCDHQGQAKVAPVHRLKFKCSACGGTDVAWQL